MYKTCWDSVISSIANDNNCRKMNSTNGRCGLSCRPITGRRVGDYGQEKFKFIEPGNVDAAISSANAIGDDRLQTRSTGFASPEKYTHGTSRQRVKWFKRGLETGDLSLLKEIFQTTI